MRWDPVSDTGRRWLQLKHPLPWVIDKQFPDLWRLLDDDGNVIAIGIPPLIPTVL